MQRIEWHYNYYNNNALIIILSPLWGFSGIMKQIFKWTTTWLKISTDRRRTRWLFYKRDQGFELASTKSKIQPVVRVGLELRTSRLQVQRFNHLRTMPPIIIISPAKGKKMRWEKWKRRGGESQSKNKKLRLLCHLKVCFLHMLKLQKVKFYVWIERPQSVWPVNGFVWALYRQTVRRKWLDQLKNASFGKIPRSKC